MIYELSSYTRRYKKLTPQQQYLRILVRHKEGDHYLVFVGTHGQVQAFIRDL